MHLDTTLSRNFKTTIGILSLLFGLLVLSIPVEAVTEWKRAVIRASDGHVYEVQYIQPLSIENFSINGLNGENPSREVAAELYIAAIILNLSPINQPTDLESHVEEVYRDTVEVKTIHEIAKVIGTAPYKVLLAKLGDGVSAAAAVGDVAALIGGVSYEAAVLIKARTVGVTFAGRATHASQIFNEHLLFVEQGNQASIDNIKLAYLSWWKEYEYSKLTRGVVNDYLFLPDRWDRVANFLISLVPYASTVGFFSSAVLDQIQLDWLEEMLESAEEDVTNKASAQVDDLFNGDAIERWILKLESEGFYDRAPTIERSIEDMRLMVDDGVRLLDLATIFNDPNGDRLEHSVEVTDRSVADVEVILFRPDGELVSKPFLEITPKRIGTTEVTIKATDPTRFSVTQTFDVTVDPSEAPNQPPRRVSTIPAQTLMIDSDSPLLELSTYFHDPEGDMIFYTVESSNLSVARTERVGSELTILPSGVGTTTITVTAGNSDGPSTTQTFMVTVAPAAEPPVQPISQGLNVGDDVIVQNTRSDGLNVRSDPQVSNQNPDNRIGLVNDGGTGTITAGHHQRVDGYIWWEVEWDVSDKVQWVHQPTNKRGWSVESIGGPGLLAQRPAEPITQPPVPQPFDLAIESFRVSKDTLDPGEAFTLFITIHNKGPGDSPGPALSYYYSSIQGFSVADPPRLQGTVDVEPLASGERITKSIPLNVPTAPKTYYYGAWLAANAEDTDINNDYATEVGVTVVDDAVAPSDTSDVVVENISVDYNTMYPEERFTVSVTVRNAGGRSAPNVRLRFYRSSDPTYSTDDVEIEDASEFIGGLHSGDTEDEDAHFDAPSEPGVYYYIVRADKVRNEVNTDNNYEAIKITVLPPAVPDLVVSLTVEPSRRIVSLRASEYLIDPEDYFRLDALVENQGKENSRSTTTVRFYRSLDPIPSPDDEEIATDTIRALREGRTDEGVENGPAPTEPGTYYYYACVDSVSEERNTDNNCSNVIIINVRGPDLVVNSVLVDYFSGERTTVQANGIFELEVTARNEGSEDADDSTLRYYISSDAILSEDDTEVATDWVNSLDPNETSRTYKSDWIRVPYTSGYFYALVCVDSVEDETDTTNNCYAPIKLTVRNYAPRAVGTVPMQTLTVGTSVSIDISAYFADTNNDNLTYTASSNDPNITTVRVSGRQVTLTPHQSGNASVTVTASDGELTATQTFPVSVVAAPPENEAPVAVSVIPMQSLTVDEAPGTVDISAYFSDANDDPLTYAAWQDDKTVVKVKRDGSLLTITPKAAGQATVTVRARDPDGLKALQRISVSVAASEVPAETWMPDANLRAAVRDALGLARNDALTQQALLELTSLKYLGSNLNNNRKIADLTGLEYALNLEHLELYRHLISDLRPLEGLAKLSSLWLAGNRIANIRPLTSLPLESLDLSGNPIADFAPLAELTSLTRLDFWGNGLGDKNLHLVTGLTQLTQLNLGNNQISDITTLTKLVNLKKLQLKGNPIADTAPLLALIDQNPGLEIDIEISDEPPSEPDESEGPNLVVASTQATVINPGSVFRLDVVIRNQGKVPSEDALVRFYLSTDETFSTEDTQLETSDLSVVAPNATLTKSVRITIPKPEGVYYYGVCIEGVADESNRKNNCVKIFEATVGTPATTEPETGEDPLQADLLAKQVLQKHGRILRRQDVKEVLPGVLTTLKEPDVQPLLNPTTINLVIKDPDLLKTIVPTISDKFITLMKTDAAIQALLSDAQVQTLLQTPAAIDELARLLGISVAPPPTANTHWMPDTELRSLVRTTLKLPPGEDITQQKLKKLTQLFYGWHDIHKDPDPRGRMKDLNGLEHATNLKGLDLYVTQISNLTPLTNLRNLKRLQIAESKISNIKPLANLNLTNLVLFMSQVSDLTPLTNLRNLTHLALSGNQVVDIRPLTNLRNLTRLYLDENQIVDITPIEGMTKLTELTLSGNPIADLGPLRRLKAKNPNMLIDIDLNAQAAPSAPVLPDETTLLPNYPNPFNPETWIPYQLAEAAEVTVTIYDVRGVAVRRLALGHRPPGFYQRRARAAHWDGRNALGEKVASGLYFYTFTAGDFTATGKMLIRK